MLLIAATFIILQFLIGDNGGMSIRTAIAE